MNQTLLRTTLANLLFLSVYVLNAQNVGIGTSAPVEKLHVAGTFRVDDLQTALAASAVTDKMVWVDANGKVYSFPAGTPGKVLGVNGTGILAWLDQGMSTTLNNSQIWIGNAANTAQPQTLSGDAIVSNTGVVTIQDNAVDGTDITISGESNGSLMYFNGTDWVNLGIGTPGQVLTISGGVPAWVSLPAAPTTGNLTTTTSGVTVTGGTGAVLGAGATVNVATNALNQNGLVTGPTAANALQAWGTDALGNPGWVPVSSLLPANDVIAGAGNNAVSITSGTNQVIGASDVTINVATNALSQDGVVTGTTAANVNDVWGTNGAGVPAWRDPNSLLTTNDVVSSNTAINITNGIGQVVGGANLTIAAQMNALNQNGFVPGPTAANANQVWATNGAGVPAWQNANNAIIKNDLLAGVANNAVSITNGTGQIVGGLNATVNVATNALNQAGVVTGTTAANANQVWGTNGLGVPGWITPVNDDWHIIGNTGTNSATNFIGTIDNTNFVTRTNNLRRSTVFNDGRIKIGSGTNFAYGLSRMEIEGEGVQPHISYVSDYPSFIMMRHQGTLAAPTSLNNGDNVGEIRWYGYNTSSYYQTARILSYVDGPPVANAIPGSLIFMTNTAGNSVTDEKMIIKNNGNVGIGTFAMGGPLAKLHVFATGANWNVATSNGDFYVGDATYRFKLGVATGGGGAGDVRLSAHGGTNRLFLGGGTNTNVAVVDGTNQRVGVNTFDPNTGLDVVGDIALKTTAATLTGTAPNFAVNTTTTPRSYYRVSSPTANFNILSLNNPANAGGTGTVDGRVVTLYNATTFTMTLSNQNAGATAAERIITGTGANLTINAGGTVTLVYNTTDSRWVVKDYSNEAGGSAWNLTGNTGTTPATNFIGTTDNVDFVTRTNNTEVMRATNAQRIGIGVTAPTTKLEVNSGTGDAIYGHSSNVGGYLGYETNFIVGTAGTIQGAGVWAANPAAGYTSLYAQSSGAATVAASINFSNVWIASYSLVDNSSATFNPSASYAQLNNTSATMGAGAFKNAIYGYSNRGTTAGNPGYTVGLNGIANSQNEDAIGVVGRAFCNSGFTLGGYFEGNNYAGTNVAYAYVGGNDGFGATKITGTGAVAEIVPTPNHGRVKLFCPESPEYWYQDYGTVNLTEGFAHVELDPILAEIIVVNEENPIKVFATPVNMLYFEGVTITNQTATGFDLVELNGAKHSGKVDYQLICKPKTNFGQGRFPQGRGPAWLKPEMEPAAAKAANQPRDIFYWPADHIQYNYNPEDMIPVGEIVPAGPHAGMFKLGDGTFSRNLPVNKDDLKAPATNK